MQTIKLENNCFKYFQIQILNLLIFVSFMQPLATAELNLWVEQLQCSPRRKID